MAANNNNPGCLGILFPFLRPKNSQKTEDFPYRLRDDFLSPAEFSFYKVLSATLGTRFTIQSKVRLADIFFVANPNKNISFFNRIAQRHLDFLICDSVTMKPLMGIELDDSSHKKSERQEKDSFLNDVFQAANFPIIRFPVQREYNSNEIITQIAPVLKNSFKAQKPPSEINQIPLKTETPLCPKCNIPMVLRTVSQGEHKGKQFYGCANYPRCREMKPVSTQKMA